MDVPAPFAGTIGDLHVKVGDKVSQGTLLLTIEPSSADEMAAPSKAAVIASEGAPSEAAAPDAIASALEAEGPPPPAPPPAAPAVDAADGALYASPSVRRRRTGARRRPSYRDGHRPEGQDHARGPRRRAPRRRRPARVLAPTRSRAVAVARLLQAGARGARAALADPADRGAEPGAQLGADPPRHAQRRGRHHRARGVAGPLEPRARRRGPKGDDGLIPRRRVGGDPEGVPGLQRLARRRRADPQALLQHRVRGRHPGGAGRAGDQERRRQGSARDRHRALGALGARSRGQARAGGDQREHVHDLFAGRDRGDIVHPDRQCTRGRDPGRHPGDDEARLGRAAVRSRG